MKKLIFGVVFGVLITMQLHAQKLTVFVAVSAKHALAELRNEFLKNHPMDEIELVFGASGKAYTQFSNGLPYDMFFSADTKYPAQIAANGEALSEPKIYASGVLALYALKEEHLQRGIEGVLEDSVKNFSIANPKVAPYGAASIEVLKSYGIFEKMKHKIVMGDNLSQAIHFIDTGAASMGLVALSLLREGNETKGAYRVIDENRHTPLLQAFVITKHAQKEGKMALANSFGEFVLSPSARNI